MMMEARTAYSVKSTFLGNVAHDNVGKLSLRGIAVCCEDLITFGL